ncbi:acyl-CoA thioesterase [Spongiactinospora rosea]|uniref:Acyl-CoA thioesterase n=1 Tax=Spongiactinospora rosea TaxID=2248750 RepID=A0A366M5A4_9ACTN|nr:acyl-CoA thioesterase [Spongiactinospora rosea]RBQ20622.1 acyl-CoA thioesterase [Spongiactinospora rosea]
MSDRPSVTYVVRVEWSDTDAAGHHHNTAVTRFVEAAEAALTRERGLTGYFGSAPRVRYEVEFEQRLYFGQQVTVMLNVEAIGTSSMTFGFEVWGEEFDGRPRRRAARGRYVTVHVPLGEDRSRPWPTSWIAALS